MTVIDLVAKGPTTRLFSCIMNANLASIMPQVVAVWCEELGHTVRYICYLGAEDLTGSLAAETDVLIVSSYTRSALLSYALSNVYRRHGAITVLGGPHARCYPEDASKYFDYVLDFTDKDQVAELLRDCAPQAVDVAGHALSRRGIWRRFRANRGFATKALNLVRGSSSNRVRYQSKISRMLDAEPAVRRYFEGESEVLPDYYRDRIKSSLGPLWDALPGGALAHDQNAYLNTSASVAHVE